MSCASQTLLMPIIAFAYSPNKKEKNQKKELTLTTSSFLSLYISFFSSFFMLLSFFFSFFVRYCSYLILKKKRDRIIPVPNLLNANSENISFT